MIVIDSDSAMIIVLIQTRVSVLYFFFMYIVVKIVRSWNIKFEWGFSQCRLVRVVESDSSMQVCFIVRCRNLVCAHDISVIPH